MTIDEQARILDAINLVRGKEMEVAHSAKRYMKETWNPIRKFKFYQAYKRECEYAFGIMLVKSEIEKLFLEEES